MTAVAILGSCITRDSAEHFPSSWSLKTYIARQSFLSFSSVVTDPVLTSHHFDSPFQDRMFHGDLQGNALRQLDGFIDAHGEDSPMILIDLIDERLGVMVKDNGEVFTRSYEALTTDVFDRLDSDWKLHPFGSALHMLGFTQGAETLKSYLTDKGMWNRTYVLGAKWAIHDEIGNPVPSSMGLPADQANELYSQYYGYLDAHGWTVVSPQIDPVASSTHKWGLAPFHYADSYYRAMLDAVEKAQQNPRSAH